METNEGMYSNHEPIVETTLITNDGRVLKRRWPLEVTKMLLLSMFLGGGLLIGVTITLLLQTSLGPYFYPSSNPTTANKTTLAGGGGGKFNTSTITSTTITTINATTNPNNNSSSSSSITNGNGIITNDNSSSSSSSMTKGNSSSSGMITNENSVITTTTTTPFAWKVAFMFLVRGPLPLGALWERFFEHSGSPHLYSIYVHASPGFTLNLPPSSVFYNRFIPSQQVQWGRLSMYDAERRLLENALLDPMNERFVLLSEACIPLYSFQTIYKYLISSQYSFVESFIDPRRDGRGRFFHGMFPAITLEQWQKGSQWFEMSRKLAIYVVGDTYYYPKFKDFCKLSYKALCLADEHYLATFMSIEFKNEIAKRSITWVDWSRRGAHPAMFGAHDITREFLENIRSQGNCTYNDQPSAICFLFARKFSPNALEPLLNLSHSFIEI